MDGSHVAIGMVGAFIGSFVMTVLQNETRRAREARQRAELYREMFIRGRWFPESTQPAPPAPPASLAPGSRAPETRRTLRDDK
jgi:hypothetical protein